MSSQNSVCTCVLADERAQHLNQKGWVLLLYLITVAGLLVSKPVSATETHETRSADAISVPVDPNKGPSELNHHIAGWALIGIGVLALSNMVSSPVTVRVYTWPVLFAVAGLFLALWSDGEIWPRGNLSWSWLLQHDAEA